MLLVNRAAAWCLLGCVLVATAGRAQQVLEPSPPDPARVAAARRLLEANGAVDLMLASIRASLPAQRATMPQLPDEFWTRFEARVVEDAPQLADSIAVLYARTFAREDLEALIAFFGSALGQRLRQLQPALVSESSAIGQRWGARIGAEIGASLQKR